MAETPESDGVQMNGTRDDLFDYLRENRDTRCVGLTFPGLGARLLIRVSPSSPADELFYDVGVLCLGHDGDPEHEPHPIDGRELQTRREVEEILDAMHSQEMLAGLASMLGMGNLADLN